MMLKIFSEKTLVLDMIKTAMNNEEQLLQQQEQEMKEPIIVPSPLPPRTATAKSGKRSRSMKQLKFVIWQLKNRHVLIRTSAHD